MSLVWMLGIRHTAVLDEAEQIAVCFVQEPFASVRELYGRIGFSAADFANDLGDVVSEARTVRAAFKVAQNAYELHTDQRGQIVDRIVRWFGRLHAAARFAKTVEHPHADPLAALCTVPVMTRDSWTQGVDTMDVVPAQLATLGDLDAVGLSADFADQGKALRAELTEERTEAARSEAERLLAEKRVGWLIGDIVARLETIVAAQALVRALTGEDPPGLELTLVKGAAAETTSVRERAPARPRNLFHVPLRSLLDQAEDTEVHLGSMAPIQAALTAAGFDLAGLGAALTAAIAEGHATALAERVAEVASVRARMERDRINDRFRRWAELLRARLAAVATTDPEVAGAVRDRLPSHPGRRFRATVESLRLTLPELERAASRDPVGWQPALVADGRALLERADGAARDELALAEARRRCSERSEAARNELRSALRALRSAWSAAVRDDRSLPEMSVGRLLAYLPRTPGADAS